MDSDQHGGKAAEVKDDKQSAGVEDSSKLNKTERCEKAITECRKDFEKLKKRETTEKAMTESGSGSMVPMNVMDSVMRENKLLRQQLKALLNKCGRTMEEYLDIQRYQEINACLKDKLNTESLRSQRLGQEVDQLRQQLNHQQSLMQCDAQQHQEEVQHLKNLNHNFQTKYTQNYQELDELRKLVGAAYQAGQAPAMNMAQRCSEPVMHMTFPGFSPARMVEADNEMEGDKGPESVEQPTNQDQPTNPDQQEDGKPLFVKENHDEAVD